MDSRKPPLTILSLLVFCFPKLIRKVFNKLIDFNFFVNRLIFCTDFIFLLYIKLIDFILDLYIYLCVYFNTKLLHLLS